MLYITIWKGRTVETAKPVVAVQDQELIAMFVQILAHLDIWLGGRGNTPNGPPGAHEDARVGRTMKGGNNNGAN